MKIVQIFSVHFCDFVENDENKKKMAFPELTRKPVSATLTESFWVCHDRKVSVD